MTTSSRSVFGQRSYSFCVLYNDQFSYEKAIFNNFSALFHIGIIQHMSLRALYNQPLNQNIFHFGHPIQ